MSKPMWVIVIGIILLIGGIAGGTLVFLTGIKDPSQVAEETLIFEGQDQTKMATLNAGKYDVWFEGTFPFGHPGEVEIRDMDDDLIFSRNSLFSMETVTINNQPYSKVGSFTIQNPGDYNVTVENPSSVFITPPISALSTLGIFLVGVGIGILGGILLFVGIILLVTGKSKPEQPPQYPPQQPPQYPPPGY